MIYKFVFKLDINVLVTNILDSKLVFKRSIKINLKYKVELLVKILVKILVVNSHISI